MYRNESLVEVTQDYGLNETYDDQGLAIYTIQLKILHALKVHVLPNTDKNINQGDLYKSRWFI